MGVFDVVRGRNTSQLVDNLTVSNETHEPKDMQDVPEDAGGERKNSLTERNAENVEKHPDEVTQDAYLGVQKAEAAALVWSKKAVYLTYAWYVAG